MKMNSLLLLAFLCATGLIVAESEDFSDKSLEELKVIYVASMKHIAGTPERKKMDKIQQKRKEVVDKFEKARLRCCLYKTDCWTCYINRWIEGVSENDCNVAAEYEKEVRQLNSLLAYADQQAIIVNPELKTIVDCIVKKQYEAIDITNGYIEFRRDGLIEII